MSMDDFCKLSFDEFAAVYNAYKEQRDADFKDKWERMRLLACITIQPHIDGKKGKVTPEKLLPFPWEKNKTKKTDAPKLTADEQRARMKRIVEKLGDELI